MPCSCYTGNKHSLGGLEANNALGFASCFVSLSAARLVLYFLYCTCGNALTLTYLTFIHNDIIIDKTAVLVWGPWSVVTKMNFGCSFHNMKPLDNEDKRLVSMMWRCEIIQPGKTRPKFCYGHKTAHICLVSKYAYSSSPLLHYINVIITKCHLSQHHSVQSPHTIATIFMLWCNFG